MTDKPQPTTTSTPEHFHRLASDGSTSTELGGILLSSPDTNLKASDAKGNTQGDPKHLSFSPIPGFDSMPNSALTQPAQQHASDGSSREVPKKTAEIATVTDSSKSGTTPEMPKGKWTFAIDLTMDQINKDGSNLGAQRKLQELQPLIEQSKGQKDVTIAIQVADKLLAPPREPIKLNRYTIHDGVMKLEETVDSKGMAANLEGFLKFATAKAPSDHLGLTIQSHGNGGDGLAGGTGTGSLPAVTDAIRSGLKGSGHDRLDVLNFDSCSMSTPSVLAAVRSVADHVVASEEIELGGKSFDAQNLTAAMSDLLKQPNTSAAELSKSIVEGANRNAVPEETPGGPPGRHIGADTLASFDSSKIEQFGQSLDQFGGLLSEAVQNDQTRKAVSDLIDSTKRLANESSPSEPDSGHRDLKEFVSAIKSAAETGKIPDKDGSIAQAAQKVLDAQSQMTEKFEKFDDSKPPGEDTRGGLYALLPVKDMRDGLPPALQYLIADSSDIPENSFDKKDKVAEYLEYTTREISAKLSESGKTQFQPVIDAINRIKSAQSDQDFQKEMRDLNTTVKNLAGTAVHKELKALMVKTEDVTGANQWNKFVHDLAGVPPS